MFALLLPVAFQFGFLTIDTFLKPTYVIQNYSSLNEGMKNQKSVPCGLT
jgi:hypothetical protein